MRRGPFHWLGEERGYVSDWVTQRWVQATGRSVDLEEHPWLDAPVGETRGIGPDFFDRLANREGLAVRRDGSRGLLPDFGALAGDAFDPGAVDPAVARFYERTADYEISVWSQWSAAFRPFGRLLAFLFSRRLQQLDVPLSPLDTSRGMTSEVVQLADPGSGRVLHTAWVRKLAGTGQVIYVGSYTWCEPPGHPGPCVKVAFPLPNGNALVIMRPEAQDDGSLRVVSAGRRFGDPGFYFTIRTRRGRVVARFVRSLRESIHVYPDGDGIVRADHVLTLWRATFLRLHYRLQERPPGERTADTPRHRRSE